MLIVELAICAWLGYDYMWLGRAYIESCWAAVRTAAALERLEKSVANISQQMDDLARKHSSAE